MSCRTALNEAGQQVPTTSFRIYSQSAHCLQGECHEPYHLMSPWPPNLSAKSLQGTWYALK